MADTKISALTAVTDFEGTDEFVLARSGATNKMDASDLRAGINGGYGTSLPGTPTDGQEYTLVDSTTAPTYQWRFRYNTGSSSSYKWEFVGGTDVSAVNASLQSIGGTSGWFDAATPGPSITIPRSGEYHLDYTAMFVPAAATWCEVGVAVGAGTPPLPHRTDATASGQLITIQGIEGPREFAASDSARMRYYVTDSCQVQYRRLFVRPVRVS